MFFGGDPFEHFAQHGSRGGGRGGKRPGAANADTTKLYETLGVRVLRFDRTLVVSIVARLKKMEEMFEVVDMVASFCCFGFLCGSISP
jgi:hypothetical protein